MQKTEPLSRNCQNTLQKLSEGEDIENFLSMLVKGATQQDWPKDLWTVQLAGVLTGKALVAFANVRKKDVGSYETMRLEILRTFVMSILRCIGCSSVIIGKMEMTLTEN